MSRMLSLLEAAQPRLVEDPGGQLQGLGEIVVIGRLAADVEAEALDHEAGVEGRLDEVDGLAGGGAELRGELDHRPRIGHANPQRQAGMGRPAANLGDLRHVVVGHQRLVGIEFLQGLVRLDGVGVDDLVPDEVLPRLGRQRLDVLVDDEELGHRGHVEAGPGLVERLDDRRVGIGLHGIVGLHARQQPLEAGVVTPQDRVVHDEQRRAVLLGQTTQQNRCQHHIPSTMRKSFNNRGLFRRLQA